jgi:hypothetical protein
MLMVTYQMSLVSNHWTNTDLKLNTYTQLYFDQTVYESVNSITYRSKSLLCVHPNFCSTYIRHTLPDILHNDYPNQTSFKKHERYEPESDSTRSSMVRSISCTKI